MFVFFCSLQEFRAKSYDEKYTAAAYKCTDCLKGFSEEDMLKRHIKIRHSEVCVTLFLKC